MLALHACDTATDDALARAVQWERRWSWRLRAATTTSPPSCAGPTPRTTRSPCSATASCASGSPTRSPTPCGPRSCAPHGYRVDVVEFVDSEHTPRNTLLRAVRTRGPGTGRSREEYAALAGAWHLAAAPRRAARGRLMRAGLAGLAGLVALLAVTVVATPATAGDDVAFRFRDPAIVESSSSDRPRQHRGHRQRLRQRPRPVRRRRPHGRDGGRHAPAGARRGHRGPRTRRRLPRLGRRHRRQRPPSPVRERGPSTSGPRPVRRAAARRTDSPTRTARTTPSRCSRPRPGGCTS